MRRGGGVVLHDGLQAGVEIGGAPIFLAVVELALQIGKPRAALGIAVGLLDQLGRLHIGFEDIFGWRQDIADQIADQLVLVVDGAAKAHRFKLVATNGHRHQHT